MNKRPDAVRYIQNISVSSCLIKNVALIILLLLFSLPSLSSDRDYDVYMKSDYGKAEVWIDTTTGQFKWKDSSINLLIAGKGNLAFPNLGPIIFYFSGQIEGYDWISISVKIYGTSASGFLSAYPEGELVRKVTSNLFDQNTSDDRKPVKTQKKRKTVKKSSVKPKVNNLKPEKPELPVQQE